MFSIAGFSRREKMSETSTNHPGTATFQLKLNNSEDCPVASYKNRRIIHIIMRPHPLLWKASLLWEAIMILPGSQDAGKSEAHGFGHFISSCFARGLFSGAAWLSRKAASTYVTGYKVCHILRLPRSSSKAK